MPTSAAIKIQIDDDIRDAQGANSISKAIVADSLDAVLDYIDQEMAAVLGYSRIITDIDTSALTASASIADYPNATYDVTNPSNGVIRIVPTGVTFTANKVKVQPFTFDNGGQMYHVVPVYDLLPNWLDLILVKYDGTQTGTPSVTLRKIEIDIFP